MNRSLTFSHAPIERSPCYVYNFIDELFSRTDDESKEQQTNLKNSICANASTTDSNLAFTKETSKERAGYYIIKLHTIGSSSPKVLPHVNICMHPEHKQTVHRYHLSIYQSQETYRNTARTSQCHLTLEYDRTFNQNVGHIYFEIKPDRTLEIVRANFHSDRTTQKSVIWNYNGLDESILNNFKYVCGIFIDPILTFQNTLYEAENNRLQEDFKHCLDTLPAGFFRNLRAVTQHNQSVAHNTRLRSLLSSTQYQNLFKEPTPISSDELHNFMINMHHEYDFILEHIVSLLNSESFNIEEIRTLITRSALMTIKNDIEHLNESDKKLYEKRLNPIIQFNNSLSNLNVYCINDAIENHIRKIIMILLLEEIIESHYFATHEESERLQSQLISQLFDLKQRSNRGDIKQAQQILRPRKAENTSSSFGILRQSSDSSSDSDSDALNTEIKDTSPVLFNREQAPRTATEQQGTQQLPNDAQTAATAKKKKGNATKNQQLSNGPQRVGTAKKKTN